MIEGPERRFRARAGPDLIALVAAKVAILLVELLLPVSELGKVGHNLLVAAAVLGGERGELGVLFQQLAGLPVSFGAQASRCFRAVDGPGVRKLRRAGCSQLVYSGADPSCGG